jgi:hypothetical protein
MAFLYCFVCGIRVSTVDVPTGLVKRYRQGLCCRSCAGGVEGSPLPVGEAERRSPERPEEVSEELLRGQG